MEGLLLIRLILLPINAQGEIGCVILSLKWQLYSCPIGLRESEKICVKNRVSSRLVIKNRQKRKTKIRCKTSHNMRTYIAQIADRYSLALRSSGPFIEIHNAWPNTLMRSLECEPVDYRCPPWATSCFTCTHFKACRGNWLHPQCCWVVDFDISVAMTKGSEHFNVTWALKLSFERDGLAAMVVLGSVGNVDLSSLKHNCYWRKFKTSGFKYGFSRENCGFKPNAVYSTEV